MDDRASQSVTAHLEAIARGDPSAKERLWSSVYEELRDVAAALMHKERPGHTLQPTALVNELYARLFGGEKVAKSNRAYFFAAAAQGMRRILIERGRRRAGRAMNGERASDQTLEALTTDGAHIRAEELQTLENALDALASHDPRTADVVMHRFFAGMSVTQTADVLDISPTTVKRCWAYGRSWLYRYVTTHVDGRELTS